MSISDLPTCPVCGTIDDCEHCLVEWQTDVGQWQRGEMTQLLQRLDDAASRLLGISVPSGRRPRHRLLLRHYLDGRSRVERGEDPASVADDISCEGHDFAVGCLRDAPGGIVETTITFPGIRRGDVSEWVTLWARDPETVRVHLLDVLAAVEVDLVFGDDDDPDRLATTILAG